ncbi:MAG: histidine phosphatase family protein [Bifidobacteriaceae bacterium]|jgi:broad specificity phosphatase PhoE|nr:histidine phosphatase family protein [Bifidobacteriaceae bacterium]
MVQPRTTIHLVRHGEVDNPESLLYERLAGFHLSERGRAMADRVAEHFAATAEPQVDLLLASPMERAQETAAPTAAALGLPVRIEPRVTEAASDFAGLRINLPNMLKPSALTRLYNPLRPSWGEPFADIADRMHAALSDLRAEIPGGRAIVVSHQSPIWRARLKAEGRPLWPLPRGRACSLASVTTLIYEGDQLSAVCYYEPAASLLPPELR